MNRLKGFVSLLSCGFLLACFGFLVRILNKYIGPLSQAGGRMIIAAILIAPYVFYKKIPVWQKQDNKPLFGVFIFSFPLYIIFFTLSIINTKAANAFFYLFASTTLTSFIIGKLFFNEKLKSKNIVAAILLVSGLIFMACPFNFASSWKGIVTGIIGGSLYGISNATRKFYADKVNRWMIMMYQMVSGSVFSFLLALLVHEQIKNPITVIPISALLIFGAGLAVIQILLFAGFKNFPLNLGSIVLASQLIFIEIIGVLFLKEVPTVTELIGSLLILSAIVWGNIPQIKLQRFAKIPYIA